MDSYSNIVINAVENSKNAVVKIDCLKTDKGKSIPSGSGSGFIFSSDGYIFTNCHVIHGAERIRVTLIDGRETDGELLGKDDDSDQADVKIYEHGISVTRLGD